MISVAESYTAQALMKIRTYADTRQKKLSGNEILFSQLSVGETSTEAACCFFDKMFSIINWRLIMAKKIFIKNYFYKKINV
jgi:hypothetical protein